MFSYADARPNETKLLNYLDEVGADWEEVAKSLLGYLSDDDVKDWAESNEYDIFNEEEEEKEVETRYYVCGIGYDVNNHVTDCERSFGDFDTEEEAQDKFNEAIREAEDNIDEFFRDDEPEVAYWKIQLEECEETDESIECVDVLDESDIYKEEWK